MDTSSLHYLVLAVLSILLLILFRREWKRTKEAIARRKVYLKAEILHDRAKWQLERWRIVRPFLRVGQSIYAQGLVRTMIDSYTIMLTCDDDLDEKHLSYLYGLLKDWPPPQTPPPTRGKNRREGGFHFVRIGLTDS